MSNNESVPRDPVESMLLAGGPDMAAKADALHRRMQRMQEYAGREFAAYVYFQRIAEAVQQKTGHAPEIDYDPDPDRSGQAALDVYYPPIMDDRVPGDNEQRRLIVLRETRIASKGTVVSVMPWLQVYTPEAYAENGPDTDVAELSFVREDLELFVGWDVTGGADELTKEWLDMSPDADKAISIRLQEQAEYVGYLQRCASILDMPQQFAATGFAVPPNTPAH